MKGFSWFAKARVESEGAVYRVLDRLDRREPILKDDADRRRFQKTLAEACQRIGSRIAQELQLGQVSSDSHRARDASTELQRKLGELPMKMR